jgi:hypothetical protein
MLKFFDQSFYLSRNPDAAAAVAAGQFADAETHYRSYGEAEGRQPNLIFDPVFYRANNADLADYTGLLLEHFGLYGAREKRDPSAVFATDYYLATYNDIAVAAYRGLQTPADHFLARGMTENRMPSPFFDPVAYLAANADVSLAAAAGAANAFTHFASYGIAELRDWGNGLSASDFYNDPKFKAAIFSGKLSDAFARVAEVAPFFTTFLKPEGYTYSSTLPIPVDFVPKDSTVKLLVPTGVSAGTTTLPAFIVDPSLPIVLTDGASFTAQSWAETFSLAKAPTSNASITDFLGGSDKLSLSKKGFTALTSAVGTLKAADLTVSATAIDPATSTTATALVFDGTTGILYYNSDGASVAKAMAPLVELTGLATLANADISIVA